MTKVFSRLPIDGFLIAIIVTAVIASVLPARGAFVDVVDRPRLTGVSNYGFFDRLWVGIVDLAGVRWLISRRRRIPVVSEVERP